MRQINVWLFFAAAAPLQLLFLAAHFLFSLTRPGDALLREALPVAYLAVTYLQWLLFAFFISFHTKKYPVPLVMHLPHLLSFLPLVRHIMLAAERLPVDAASLSLAWVHSVATHCFSLVAAWLWQMRGEFVLTGELKQKLLPIALYVIAALTTIVLYAGLDFSFASSHSPLALGIIQLLLNFAVIALLLISEKRRIWFALAAALVFSAVNTALLFDQARADIGVEIALAAGSFTQIFSIYVLLMAGSTNDSQA